MKKFYVSITLLVVTVFWIQSASASNAVQGEQVAVAKQQIAAVLNRTITPSRTVCHVSDADMTRLHSTVYSRADFNSKVQFPVNPQDTSELLLWALRLDKNSPELNDTGKVTLNYNGTRCELLSAIVKLPSFHSLAPFPKDLKNIDLRALTVADTTGTTPLQLLQERKLPTAPDILFYENFLREVRICAAHQKSLETLLGLTSLPALVTTVRATTTTAVQTDASSVETVAAPAASSLTQASTTGVAPVRTKPTQPTSPADLLRRLLAPKKPAA